MQSDADGHDTLEIVPLRIEGCAAVSMDHPEVAPADVKVRARSAEAVPGRVATAATAATQSASEPHIRRVRPGRSGIPNLELVEERGPDRPGRSCPGGSPASLTLWDCRDRELMWEYAKMRIRLHGPLRAGVWTPHQAP